MPERARKPIRVLLCDDHRVLTDALATLIELDATLVLVTDPVPAGELAVAAAGEFRPDVVLMDVELLGAMNGYEACRLIREISPKIKVVIISGAPDADRALVNAVEAGASGFLSKTEAARRFVDAVHAAAAGESLVDSDTLTRVLRQLAAGRNERVRVRQRTDSLTHREREILRNLALGGSNEDIARLLFISPHTVQTHTRNILSKLGVHSKLQAVALAAKSGGIT